MLKKYIKMFKKVRQNAKKEQKNKQKRNKKKMNINKKKREIEPKKGDFFSCEVLLLLNICMLFCFRSMCLPSVRSHLIKSKEKRNERK